MSATPDTRVVVTDVAPRDGLQNQPVHLPTADKIALIRRLAASGIPRIEATSFVSPQAVPQMADAAQVMAGLADVAGARLCVLVPNLKGLALAAAAGAREVGVVLSATETMNQKNIRMGLDAALAECQAMLQQARAAGMATRAYVAVAFACPYEGDTPLAVTRRLALAMQAAGAEEIVLADTIGAAAPAQVQAVLRAVLPDIPARQLALHLHDTRGLGLANAWAGLQEGIRRFDASAGGLGGCPFAPGAAGNLATEDLVWMAHACGFDTGVDLPALLAAIEPLGRALGRPIGGRSHAWLRRHLGLAPHA